MPVTLICKECGASYKTHPKRADISKYCSRRCKAKAQKRMRPPNRLDVDVEYIRKLYESGMSGEAIAAKIGVSPIVVYHRLREMGIVRSNSEAHIGLQAGERNPNWKGGRYIDSQGYVVVRVAPNKYVREHRLVAERMLGRKLRPGEVVHHINGDRTDNRPENICVPSSRSEHMKIHMTSDEARRRARRSSRAALLAVAGEAGDDG